jgi:hypothetical protein
MHWKIYAYHFGLGGLILLLGLVVIVRTGACKLRAPKERLWFFSLVGGYVWLALIYFLWIQAALHF